MRRRCRAPTYRPTGTRRCRILVRGVFSGLARPLAQGFRGADRLYGYARHIVETTFLATSNGLRRRYTQPTGSVEINAKRDGASAWAGVSTPDFVDVPIDSLLEQLSTQLGWAKRTVELPAGRYETIMPPSTVADMMIYLAWSMDGRAAQEGRTALSAPGGGTRVGEKLTELPLTLYSDPAAAGLECTPFVAVPSSSERVSVFDNGMDIARVDWIRQGAVNALAYPRAAAGWKNPGYPRRGDRHCRLRVERDPALFGGKVRQAHADCHGAPLRDASSFCSCRRPCRDRCSASACISVCTGAYPLCDGPQGTSRHRRRGGRAAA